MGRELLPERRQCLTINFRHNNILFDATIGFYDDGRPGEVFLRAGKAGTAIHTYVRDSAIAISFALQHGVTVEQIRSAFTRDPDGVPEGPLGVLMDMIAEGLLVSPNLTRKKARGKPPPGPV